MSGVATYTEMDTKPSNRRSYQHHREASVFAQHATPNFSRPITPGSQPATRHSFEANRPPPQTKVVSAADLQARIKAARRRTTGYTQLPESLLAKQQYFQQASRPSTRGSDIVSSVPHTSKLPGHKRHSSYVLSSGTVMRLMQAEAELPNMPVRYHLEGRIEKSNLPESLTARSSCQVSRPRQFPASVRSTVSKKSPLSSEVSPEDQQETSRTCQKPAPNTSSPTEVLHKITQQIQLKPTPLPPLKKTPKSDTALPPMPSRFGKVKTKRRSFSHRSILCAV